MKRLAVVLMVASVCVGAGEARAQGAGATQPARPLHKPRVHKAAPAPSPGTRSLEQVRSDLLHGSPAQQALEREDNATAHPETIDRNKDSFFSDWKGLK